MFNNILSNSCFIGSNSRMMIDNDLEKMHKKSVVDNTEVLPPTFV